MKLSVLQGEVMSTLMPQYMFSCIPARAQFLTKDSSMNIAIFHHDMVQN